MDWALLLQRRHLMSEMLALTSSPLLSVLVWFLLLTILLYIARSPAHNVLLSLSRVLHNALRLSARSVAQAERRLAQRNREVLLAQGREAAERMVEREFQRIEAAASNELSQCPALQRELREKVTAIEEDYKKSIDVPPEPPLWAKAVEAVAKIPGKSEPMVARVLEDIHASMVKANDVATNEYRRSSRERHLLLVKMMPLWRQAVGLLRQLEKKVEALHERAQAVDRHMQHYREVTQDTDRAVRMLSSSSLTQFFISGMVLAIAVGGAMINFNLIARPMQEMVGGNTLLMGFRAADLAALVIIFVEIALGLYLMEALRITRLFPVIGALNDKMRVRMIWITFFFLLSLASIEAGLAYMRELLAQDDAALVQSLLSEGAAGAAAGQWITTAAQMGMGFILPFALVFVAIPLESFFHSSRTLLGLAGVGVLRVLAWLMRVLSNLARYLGSLLVHVYDLFIFGPLWLERMIRDFRRPAGASPALAPAARH
jgi:hypothetical protein